MSGEEHNTDGDDSDDEVVVVNKKKGSKDSPLVEKSDSERNAAVVWTVEDSYNLVTIVNTFEAHIAETGSIRTTWMNVVELFNEAWKGKPFKTYRNLKERYEKLLKESSHKDPDDENIRENEAKLWSLLEDHRNDRMKMNEDIKNKKTADAKLVQQGKEERDIASAAIIDREVKRLGGTEWSFDCKQSKIVATKDDGTTFEVDKKDLLPGTSRGGSVASALAEMAKARQETEKERLEVLKMEAKLRDEADQRRHNAEMMQREQQFQLQMQQFQLQQMAMLAQLSQSGVAIPPGFFGNPTDATGTTSFAGIGAAPGSNTHGGSNSRNNSTVEGNEDEPEPKKPRHSDNNTEGN